jgi:shikimate dehydrogenase
VDLIGQHAGTFPDPVGDSKGLQAGLEIASRVESAASARPCHVERIHVKRAFVIGHPIAHSRSPLIHGHWIERYRVDGSYEAIDVAPGDLPAFFERLKAGEFVGGNVTIPHKEQVFALVDALDPLAEEIGAVNTLVLQGAAGVRGFNTDYMGFLGNLDQHAPGWDQRLDEVVVLGAGGAARAILVALKSRNAGKIHLLNRTVGKAEDLALEYGGRIACAGLGEFAARAGNAGLIVNTSSVGMKGTSFEGVDLSVVPKAAVVTDIVYVPLVTPLLAEAQRLGLRTVDGLGMLLHQAVPGFEAWFGVKPEVTPELRALVEATL